MTIVNWMELTRPGAGELVIENRMNKPWKDSWCINGSSRPIVLPRYPPARPILCLVCLLSGLPC